MSVTVMGLVWDSSVPAPERFTLLALADQADDEGKCWPSVGTLAEKCVTGESTIRRHTGALQKLGVLSIKRRFNTSSIYTINLRKLRALARDKAPRKGSQSDTPRQSDTPSQIDTTPSQSGRSGPPNLSGPPSQSERLTTNYPSVEPPVNRQRRASRSRELVPAADLDATAHSPGSHAIVSGWADGRSLLTPQRRELMRAVDELLRQGADPARIPAALDEAHGNDEWRNPAKSLRFAYERVVRQAQPAPATTGPTRVPTTTQRVQGALALLRPDGDDR